MAGDFDDDIALLQGLAGNQAKLWVQTSAAGQFGNPVLVWDGGTTELIALNHANLVAGAADASSGSSTTADSIIW